MRMAQYILLLLNLLLSLLYDEAFNYRIMVVMAMTIFVDWLFLFLLVVPPRLFRLEFFCRNRSRCQLLPLLIITSNSTDFLLRNYNWVPIMLMLYESSLFLYTPFKKRSNSLVRFRLLSRKRTTQFPFLRFFSPRKLTFIYPLLPLLNVYHSSRRTL